MIRLEKRRSISKFWTTVTPVIAVFLTMSFGGLMFGLLLGDFSSAFGAVKLIFWDPLFDENFASYARPQLLVNVPHRGSLLVFPAVFRQPNHVFDWFSHRFRSRHGARHLPMFQHLRR